MVAASLCENLGVSAKLTIYIVLNCVAVEQKRTSVKILSVTNMLMTSEQLFFHVHSDISLAVSTRMAYYPSLASEGSKIGLFYLVACER